jgi:hypothetical protein
MSVARHRRDLVHPSRRDFLRAGLSSVGIPLAVGASGLGFAAGCASILGEQQLDTYFILKPNSSGGFQGWTEINLGTTAGPDDSATIKRVSMTAPMGVNDLTFVKNILGEGVNPDTQARVPFVRGVNFPKDDTIGIFEILYTGNVRPFFRDGTTIRLEWSGAIDTTGLTLPAEGARVDVLVTVDVGAVSEA